MNSGRPTTFLALLLLAVLVPWGIKAAPPDKAELPTAKEARGQARLLHEALHATLHVVHLEYYREDEGLAIPAATLKKVFRELASSQKVELHWLAVNAQAMNTDHQPRNDFEKQAVEALSAGKDEFERVDNGMYQRASAITLSSDCLKCHAPTRSSNKDKVAALVISLPIAKPE